VDDRSSFEAGSGRELLLPLTMIEDVDVAARRVRRPRRVPAAIGALADEYASRA